MNWIDLGLPSGNLWAVENEEGYYTFNEVVEKFRDSLPTKEDFEELLDHTYHRWNKELKGLEILTENEQKLFLPANGYRYGSNVSRVGFFGYYWSSTPNGDNIACYLDFGSSYAYVSYDSQKYRFPVRLIKRKE